MLESDIGEIAERLKHAASALSGKTLLITGGRGFLGRYFTSVIGRLNDTELTSPCRVIVLDNLITAGKDGANFKEPEHSRFVQQDIVQPFQLNEKVDYVLHSAGIASPFYYRAYPLQTLEVATIGTKNLLEIARIHGAKILFFSSSEIYGDPDPKHVPTQESYRGNIACQGPRACYDESKRLGETLCYIYHNTYGLAVNIVRPFNVYGPGMQETDYRVMPNFASRIKGSRPLNIYGAGSQTRTFCYITDAVTGFMMTLLKGVPGEAYNIGNPEPEISMLQLAREMETAWSDKIQYNVVDYPDSYPADEPQRRCPDIRKARLQLGYNPEVNLQDGLKRFLSWTDEHYTGKQ